MTSESDSDTIVVTPPPMLRRDEEFDRKNFVSQVRLLVCLMLPPVPTWHSRLWTSCSKYHAVRSSKSPRSRTRSVFHLPGEEKDLTNDKPVLLEDVDDETFRTPL